MATFIVRVWLDRGTMSEYTSLKELLIKKGFSKIITDANGVRYVLPNGNYRGESDLTTLEVTEIVRKVALKVKPNSQILVVKEVKPKGMAWNNLPLAT